MIDDMLIRLKKGHGLTFLMQNENAHKLKLFKVPWAFSYFLVLVLTTALVEQAF